MAELNEVEVEALLKLNPEQVERFIAALDAFGDSFKKLTEALSEVGSAFAALAEAIPDMELNDE